ncbi:MAG: hypothetical protein AAF960_11510, partial [Bacteroidota bacterium]
MNLAPKDLYEKLEFDKILELVEGECYGKLGREIVRQIAPTNNRRRIIQLLNEVREYQVTLGNDRFPMQAYEEISK